MSEVKKHIEGDKGCEIGTVMTLLSCFTQSEELHGELDWSYYRKAVEHLKVLKDDYKVVKK